MSTSSMNPLKQIRQELGLSQRECASVAGVTEQVILKAEQGLYPTLPLSVVKAFSYLTQIPRPELEAQYEHWIQTELKRVVLPPNPLPDSYEAFPEWRAALCGLNEVPNSVNALCKLLKLNPYVIQKYEAGRMKQTPLQLMERIAFIRGEF